MSEKNRRYRKNHPEKNRRIDRDWYLRANYGITLEDYEAMLEKQGGTCAICESSIPGGNGAFSVDHCHSTGKVRGLLCRLCNSGLGHFRDSPGLLYRAVEYLRNHEKH